MRTLELTHEEYELVTSALNFVFNKYFELVGTARELHGDIDVSGLLKQGEQAGRLRADIVNGYKDV